MSTTFRPDEFITLLTYILILLRRISKSGRQDTDSTFSYLNLPNVSAKQVFDGSSWDLGFLLLILCIHLLWQMC